MDVQVNEWVKYNDNTQVWYSADDNILPVLKNEIAKQQDAVLYIVGIYDWVYNIKPLLFLKGVKKIISVRGMLHPGALTQKAFKKKAFLFLMKLWGWQRKVVFHVTDEGEREFVIKELGIRNEELGIKVAGNFPNLFGALPLPEKEVGKLKLVSVGLISAMKNYLLVLEALRQAQGDIRYDIYGPVKDAGYWEECKAVIKTLPEHIVVNYHGAIEPLGIEAALAASHVFILPSKSENYGHSIIEALSAGRPVITSNGTPWNELREARAGINVDLAAGSGQLAVGSGERAVDSRQLAVGSGQLAEAISFFVNLPQVELDEWSRGAVAYVNKVTDLNSIKQQYKTLFGL